jgi:RNA polymerase sigma factor (sigma-70 family)
MSEDPSLSSRRRRFEALVLPHLDAAFNLARWLARDDHDAADIVQEAFLRAFDGFDGFRGDQARPWLLAIVRNTCFTWLARNRNRADQVELDEEDHAAPDFEADPEQLAQRARDRDRVDRALRSLPFEFREVVVLREFEDLSYRQIADVVGIPIGTVMSRLARARSRLARELAEGADGA